MYAPVFFRPGQQVRAFDVYRKSGKLDEKGKITYSKAPERVGTVRGTLSQASQKEIDRWKQTEHPVSHTLVLRGRSMVQAEDILMRKGEKYYVQGKDDPSDMGLFEIIHLDKRTGVNEWKITDYRRQ